MALLFAVDLTQASDQRRESTSPGGLRSLVFEKNYDSITVQEILDRADVGRSTFYMHFESMDELFISGIHDLRITLNSALEQAVQVCPRHDGNEPVS